MRQRAHHMENEKPSLVAYGRPITSPYGLLGDDENALTFALGYTRFTSALNCSAGSCRPSESRMFGSEPYAAFRSSYSDGSPNRMTLESPTSRFGCLGGFTSFWKPRSVFPCRRRGSGTSTDCTNGDETGCSGLAVFAGGLASAVRSSLEYIRRTAVLLKAAFNMRLTKQSC